MKVLSYSEDILAQELSNDSTPVDVIQNKRQYLYLKEYLGTQGLKIKTIVIEDKYISKDYLKDFAAYYATCFKDYKKYCKRIHFFTNTFNQTDLEKFLLSNTKQAQNFWNNYAGFLVVKPIPVTIIGTTVFKNYPKGIRTGERNFWGTRQYPIHLFGKDLKIDSLAFQEQDTVLSACATTSIWSMLHKASEDYTIVLKTPGEITKDAGETVPNKGRLLPNKEGLEISQMCKAIENCGLEVEIRLPIKENDKIDNQYIQKILNAYSCIGTPIILVIKVPSGFKDNNASKDQMDNVKYGLHAVAVSGFKKKALSTLNKDDKTSSVYKLIEKIYYHDDQWGPFARAEFSGKFDLDTTWTKFHESKIKPPTHVECIIIPVFSKIRISYDDIEPVIRTIATIYVKAFENILEQGLVWDLKVMYSEDFKSEIKNSELNDALKISYLVKSYPKYIWVGTCYSKENRISDYVFDATDISNAMYGIDVILHYEELKKYLFEFLKANNPYRSIFKGLFKSDYYQFIIDKLKD